jgi:predicted nuclease of restriction endonuclease-like (RecB) superfamily
MPNTITQSQIYLQTIEDLKAKINTAQIKAHLSVNKEMIILYWQIGKTILDKQSQESWGSKITKKLSEDLTKSFPNMKGFSYTNLRYMQRFSETYPDLLICPQSAGKLAKEKNQQIFYSDYSQKILGIPWGHNREILDKLKESEQRLWYANQVIENGWSRNVLVTQIKTDLYSRQAQKEIKSNNFHLTLPEVSSDLANEIFKDEYNFEFIDNSKGRLKERALEDALIDDVIKFLTELGKGFAFVGKQYHFEVDGDDFYTDLLFYHIKLKSYIVIELKTGKFKPEYVGKMGFYLACVDDYLKDKNDNNSIGIILCQDENSKKQVQDKSLRCMIRPIGVSGYSLAGKGELPKELEPLRELKKLI